MLETKDKNVIAYLIMDAHGQNSIDFLFWVIKDLKKYNKGSNNNEI